VVEPVAAPDVVLPAAELDEALKAAEGEPDTASVGVPTGEPCARAAAVAVAPATVVAVTAATAVCVL
jgi:hypothetical protein